MQIDARLPFNVSQDDRGEEARRANAGQRAECRCRAARSISSGNLCPRCASSTAGSRSTSKSAARSRSPALSGSADTNINVARFENATLPALTNFKAQLNFRDKTADFRPLRRRSRRRPVHRQRPDQFAEIDRTEFRSAPESQQRARGAERRPDRARRCRYQSRRPARRARP